MGDALTSLVAFIVAISVLVAMHEYGHYIVGRWMGMKVLRFSIGFGKPIWTWVRGADQTEYCISAIPLGGYVRFLDGREGPVEPEDEGRAFNHRPMPARIAVLFAGPHLISCSRSSRIWALFLGGIPTLRPAVGDVSPTRTPPRRDSNSATRLSQWATSRQPTGSQPWSQCSTRWSPTAGFR